MTVGQLARRVGVRPSTLRFYEAEGLLTPTAHSEAGYRLYDTAAEQTLRFIQRAQRLGFALADIRALVAAQRASSLDVAAVRQVAEARYLALERQLTPLLVLRHELALFLRDLQQHPTDADPDTALLDQLLAQICADPHRQSDTATLAWMLTLNACNLTSAEGQALLQHLRGQHIHLWHEDDGYTILVISADPNVGAALARLTELEQDCQLHAHTNQAPELSHDDAEYLLTARGDHAFLIARLFLALEQTEY